MTYISPMMDMFALYKYPLCSDIFTEDMTGIVAVNDGFARGITRDEYVNEHNAYYRDVNVHIMNQLIEVAETGVIFAVVCGVHRNADRVEVVNDRYIMELDEGKIRYIMLRQNRKVV